VEAVLHLRNFLRFVSRNQFSYLGLDSSCLKEQSNELMNDRSDACDVTKMMQSM
jgi:hypothetical protein